MTRIKEDLISIYAQWTTYSSGDLCADRKCPYCQLQNIIWIKNEKEFAQKSCKHFKGHDDWCLIFVKNPPKSKKKKKVKEYIQEDLFKEKTNADDSN